VKRHELERHLRDHAVLLHTNGGIMDVWLSREYAKSISSRTAKSERYGRGICRDSRYLCLPTPSPSM